MGQWNSMQGSRLLGNSGSSNANTKLQSGQPPGRGLRSAHDLAAAVSSHSLTFLAEPQAFGPLPL